MSESRAAEAPVPTCDAPYCGFLRSTLLFHTTPVNMETRWKHGLYLTLSVKFQFKYTLFIAIHAYNFNLQDFLFHIPFIIDQFN